MLDILILHFVHQPFDPRWLCVRRRRQHDGRFADFAILNISEEAVIVTWHTRHVPLPPGLSRVCSAKDFVECRDLTTAHILHY